MEEKQQKNPLISQLEKWKDNRGVLAALRQGLGQPPGSVPEMYPFLIPLLPKDPPRDMEAAYYTTASLFAMHPQSTESGNMGSHFAQACRLGAGASDEAIERRFTALLAAHPDDLPGFLRQAISFLRSKEIPVNWNQLLRDIQQWDSPRRFVQKRWAEAFWKTRQPTETVQP